LSFQLNSFNFQLSCPENCRSVGVRGVMYLFITAVFIFTIFGNLAIIISISYFKQLHSPTNFLILSMAVTDFLLGFAIMPYSMVRSVENCWDFGIIFCGVHYSFDPRLSLASILHLCCIGVDWFYAMCHPLHDSSTMTPMALRQIVAVCWPVPAAFAFGVVFSEAHASGIEGYELLIKCSGLFGLFAPACIMIGIYVKIFTVSQRHTSELSLEHRLSKNNKKYELSKNKDGKAVKALTIFFAILIDPFLIFSTPLHLFDSLNWLGYLNSFCNPLLHGFFYQWFQKTLKYILRVSCCSQANRMGELFWLEVDLFP
uniref:Trace amine associated receptor 2 n=1 Tax=Corvus moneduloides TaxID=1196302 RepID=A0A8C3E4S3_CORMO